MEYKDLAQVNSEIKTTPIKGKEYAEVPQRVNAFRKLFPEGTIRTEMLACDGGVCVFRAEAYNGEILLGTGHAYEKEGSTFINKTSYIENCETSAVGRALGFVGIGSETSMASYEEVANAQANQTEKKPEPKKKRTTNKTKDQLISEIETLVEKKGETITNVCEMGGVIELSELEEERLEACITWLNGLEDVA